jgi:hypothetical protein
MVIGVDLTPLCSRKPFFSRNTTSPLFAAGAKQQQGYNDVLQQTGIV